MFGLKNNNKYTSAIPPGKQKYKFTNKELQSKLSPYILSTLVPTAVFKISSHETQSTLTGIPHKQFRDHQHFDSNSNFQLEVFKAV